MAVFSETVIVPSVDGLLEVFVARPEGPGPHPGLVVAQEAFGVNDHVKDVTRRFAEQGYVAVAPDMFHRFEQRIVPYSDVQTAVGLAMKLTDDMAMNDVNAAIAYLKEQPDLGKVGMVGFCLGGRTAYLAATRSTELAAAVGYYGAGIADPRNPVAPITATASISAPIVLFFGGQDRMLPPHHMERIQEALSSAGKNFRIKVYPGAGHGFFCDARPDAYDADAASDSWGVTLEFLRESLF